MRNSSAVLHHTGQGGKKQFDNHTRGINPRSPWASARQVGSWEERVAQKVMEAVARVTKYVVTPSMKTGWGEIRMLISALLGLLRHHDVTRGNAEAKKGVETFKEVAAAAITEDPSPANPHEAGNADLTADRVLGPPIAEDKSPLPPDSNVEYASFIKAVDRLVKNPREHSLDIFE